MKVKTKIAISIGVVIAVMAIIIYFVILPTVNDIESISDAVYIERVDLERKYLRGQLLKKTIENFKIIEPEKERLKAVFIIEGNELEFITTLEEIATLYGLKQTLKLNNYDDSTNADYRPLLSQISISGKFIDLLKYLENLERSNFYFNISSLVINTANTNEITANIKGQVFVVPATEIKEEVL